MFDSPLHYCDSCRHFVALDEGFEECRRLHGCEAATCPMARLFEPPQTGLTCDPRTPEAIALAVLVT